MDRKTERLRTVFDDDRIVGRLREFLEHLTPATLASYVDGRLSQAERNRADEHLARCAECTTVLANVVKTKRELEG